MLIDPYTLTSRSWLGRFVRLPLRLVPSFARLRVLSGPIRGARWRAGSSVAGCWVGTYEGSKARVLARAVSAGMTVWDVGANAGYYTILFSRLVGREGRVLAFEPFAENVRNLLDHVTWNGAANVQLLQAAVADRTGMAGFQIAPESNRMGRLSPSNRSYLIPTISFDQCVETEGLPPPDLVKLDVEGGEVAALRGAVGLLRAGRTRWYVSTHGAEELRGSVRLLREHGHRVSDLAGTPLPDDVSTFGGDEIVGIPPGLDPGDIK